MNKDQVKGAVKEATGKVPEKVGAVTGNTSQELKGIVKKVQGKAQKAVGNVKAAFKDAKRTP